MAVIASLCWPLAALLSGAGAGAGAADLISVIGVGAMLLVVALAASRIRPLVPAGVRTARIEPFAQVRGRLRMSDPGAEGHVRSRAPGGVG